jgi:hypothetical protein
MSGDTLVCAECDRHDPGDEPGWTLRLDVDDEPVAFCPECDREEFRGALKAIFRRPCSKRARPRHIGFRSGVGVALAD